MYYLYNLASCSSVMTGLYSTSKLVDVYKRAFVDSKVVADPMFSPQLLTNRGEQNVLTAIENELKGCDDLFFSVAFITMGGIAPLLGTLKDLEKNGANVQWTICS